MAEQLKLYSYWRSSAAYRVRIGLNLKGLAYETIPVHLVRDGGQQHHPDYVARNPQHLVPTLLHGTRVIRQSLAVLEYLDEAWPSPRLLPMTARDRARVRALAQMVTSDIHPLNNLRVLQYFENTWHVPHAERDDWIKHWIVEGFTAMETLLSGDAATGVYCHGQTPGMADCCLVPQIFNARRFGVEMDAFPTLTRIEQACLALPAFDQARPEKQPDAQP
ncbi:maleylacetoacetate isomerase [Pseudoxanthomonas beigongshangi]|jgi:maleylacetoacetate isomerase